LIDQSVLLDILGLISGWTGQSNTINGQISIDFNNPSNSVVNISIPIISFDSGNDNRDSNMLFVTDEDKYPNLSFSSTDILAIDQSDYKVNGLLNFHGIEIEITIPVKVSIDSNLIEFNSTFKVNLNDYNIERPKLLLKPISELIEVELFIKGTI